MNHPPVVMNELVELKRNLEGRNQDFSYYSPSRHYKNHSDVIKVIGCVFISLTMFYKVSEPCQTRV